MPVGLLLKLPIIKIVLEWALVSISAIKICGGGCGIVISLSDPGHFAAWLMEPLDRDRGLALNPSLY